MIVAVYQPELGFSGLIIMHIKSSLIELLPHNHNVELPSDKKLTLMDGFRCLDTTMFRPRQAGRN